MPRTSRKPTINADIKPSPHNIAPEKERTNRAAYVYSEYILALIIISPHAKANIFFDQY